MAEQKKISGSNKHMVTMPDGCGDESSANEVINLGAGFPHFFQFQIQGLFQVKQVIFKVSSMQNSRTFPG